MKDIHLAELFDQVYNNMKKNNFEVSGLFDTKYIKDLWNKI